MSVGDAWAFWWRAGCKSEYALDSWWIGVRSGAAALNGAVVAAAYVDNWLPLVTGEGDSLLRDQLEEPARLRPSRSLQLEAGLPVR